MIKNIIKIISIIITILLILIFYLNIYGINTTQFNSFIKKEINSYNNQLDIELKKVKLILNLKDFSLSIKTLDPLLLYENQSIKIKELSTNLSIKAYLGKNFVIQKLFVKSDENEVKNLIKIYKSINNSPQIFLIDQMVKKGTLITKIKVNFNENGKVKSDYKISGEINIPILLNGGRGIPQHMIEPFTSGVDGLCAGSIFYFSQYSYKDIKDFLIKNKINVRPS